jgi:UDP-4-amino-4-deoxy-L-arabinose-oxoglutarate aminotransferase
MKHIARDVSRAPLPFAKPDIGEEEIRAVTEALRSGWVTSGRKVREFEASFGDFLGGTVECVAVNSATAGLHLALEAIGVAEGDDVLLPAYTFTATAEVVRYLGAHPRFVDIDEATLNIDPEKLEAAITPRTRAVIVVHFAGLACDMDSIRSIVTRHGIHLIEDAAHAFPASYRGQAIGTLPSDATVFSFYATKTLTTGEGGMIVTRNERLAERSRIMRLHGISRGAFDRYTSAEPAWRYEVVAPGFKYNLTDLAAAIGIEQLKKAVAFQTRRASIASRYSGAFATMGLTVPPTAPPGDIHAWHLYALRLPPELAPRRDAIIEHLFSLGIGCSVHFIPLHLHAYWRDRYCLAPNDFPVSVRCFEREISLPIYTLMSDDEVLRVIDAVAEAVHE